MVKAVLTARQDGLVGSISIKAFNSAKVVSIKLKGNKTMFLLTWKRDDLKGRNYTMCYSREQVVEVMEEHKEDYPGEQIEYCLFLQDDNCLNSIIEFGA
jgi:hypothetical protein